MMNDYVATILAKQHQHELEAEAQRQREAAKTRKRRRGARKRVQQTGQRGRTFRRRAA